MKKRLLLLSVAMLTAVCAFAQNETRRFSERENRSEREMRSERETNLRSRQEQRSLLLPIQSLDVLRASQQTVLLLDSMIVRINPVFAEYEGVAGMKTAFHYNSAGHLILEINYVWNNDTRQWEERDRRGFDNRGNVILDIYTWTECLDWDWENCLEYELVRYKWTAEYDANDNRILGTSYRYNFETNTYVRRWREENAFDSHGNPILGIQIDYNEDGTVAWGGKRIRAFDDRLGWQTMNAEYRWEDGGWSGEWGGRQTAIYTDNADSFTIAENEYRWENGGWQIRRKNERTHLGSQEDGGSYYDVDDGFSFPSIPQVQRTTQLMRSSIEFWEDSSSGSRIEYTLNADGTIAESRRFDWNNNTWEESSRNRFEYTFNTHGMLTLETRYWWDFDTNTWFTSEFFTITYTFDSRNNPLSYQRSVDGKEYRRVYFTYDAQDRAITAEVYVWGWRWNWETGTDESFWRKSESFERTFDNQGRVILADHTNFHAWDDGNSATRQIHEQAFDANGRRILNIHRYYSYQDIVAGIIGWASGEKREYAFDANDRRIMEARWNYDNELRAFVGSWKRERAYDANGNTILWISFDFDLNTMAFVPRDREVVTYTDVKINIWGEYNYMPISQREYVWENGVWVLEFSFRWDWTFDQENNPLTARVYMQEAGMPEMWFAAITFYYSLHLTNLQSVTNNDLRVWISGGELHIEGTPTGSAVQIFDTQGRQMLHTTWTNSTINISHLQSGIYIVRVGESVVKVVKR